MMTSHEDGGNLLSPFGLLEWGGLSHRVLNPLETRVPPAFRVKHAGPPLTSLRGTEGMSLGSHNEIKALMDATGFSMG